MNSVGAVAAEDGVAATDVVLEAGISPEHVVVEAAVERVVTRAADEQVAARVAAERVVADVAVERVVARAAGEVVVILVARQAVVSAAARNPVTATTASDHVVAGAAGQHVVSIVAEEPHGGGAIDEERVVASAAMEFDRDVHRRVDDDRVVTATGIAVDRGDACEGLGVSPARDVENASVRVAPDTEIVVVVAEPKGEPTGCVVESAEIVSGWKRRMVAERDERDVGDLVFGVDERDGNRLDEQLDLQLHEGEGRQARRDAAIDVEGDALVKTHLSVVVGIAQVTEDGGVDAPLRPEQDRDRADDEIDLSAEGGADLDRPVEREFGPIHAIGKVVGHVEPVPDVANVARTGVVDEALRVETERHVHRHADSTGENPGHKRDRQLPHLEHARLETQRRHRVLHDRHVRAAEEQLERGQRTVEQWEGEPAAGGRSDIAEGIAELAHRRIHGPEAIRG